ncbi:FIST N-terminal domain-containing protein [Actinoplanes sp. NPDC023714]|uniref:FIST N-terminal domain-containing protein n=1 Tax=Actinoplanes sp. NPDC023714 TaxID=3154322 RepID=UPI00340149F5
MRTTPLLVVLSVVCAQTGGAVARTLFEALDPPGVLLARLAIAAMVLAVVARPAVWSWTAAAWRATVLLGVFSAGLNMLAYLALSIAPQGVVVTASFAGPLLLSLAQSRRPADLLWALTAGTGVVLLGVRAGHDVPLAGLLLALSAGACGAGYIVCSARVGKVVPGLGGLMVSFAVGALLVLPVGAEVTVRVWRHPWLVAGLVAVAVLSSVVPYALELIALRRLPTRVFGVLMSLQPAAAAIAGLLILDQRLGPVPIAALVLVTAASLGVTRPQQLRTAADGTDMHSRDGEASRWMGVGHSASDDAGTAGKTAAAQAVGGRDPALLIVFASTRYDYGQLLDGVRGEAGEHTAIVGCTTTGAIALGPDAARAGVVVTALGGPGLEVRTAVGRNAAARPQEAGADAAAGMAGLTKEHRAGLLLCDGLTGAQHEVVRGAYSVVSAVVPLVGGCAGDDMTFTRTYQFHGDRNGVEVLSDAVVGVSLGSDAKIGVGIAHGWQKQGEPMIVTHSDGGRLYELDDAPALDAYLQRIGADRSLAADPQAFQDAAFAKPLGLSRRTGEDIRTAHAADLEDGSLVFIADVPQGALVWEMATDEEALVAAGAESCRQAIEGIDGADAAGLLVFDCGIRRARLGPGGVEQEIAAMERTVPGVPMAGFYTYGEFARTRGARGMHYLTVVTLAVA